MFIANTKKNGSGERCTARPGMKGFCPLCNATVIPKCGRIVKWHWAHSGRESCDSWKEPMTLWHLSWQETFPFSQREIVIDKMGQKHRADVQISDGTVIEFQHSNISVDEIMARESFYISMIWVFDAIEAYQSNRFDLRPNGNAIKGLNYATFRWKHPRKSILKCKSQVILDFGEGLFLLKWMGKEAPYGGCGWIISRENFLNQLGVNK